MRKTKTCPKCNGKKLLSIDAVPDDQGGGSDARQAHLAIRHEGYSFMGNEKRRTVGNLQAVMCSECGFTEFYCANPTEIQPDGKLISWLT